MSKSLDEQFDLVRKLENPILKKDRKKNKLFKIKEGSFLKYEEKLLYVKTEVKYEEKKGKKVVDSWNEFELVSLDKELNTYFCEIEEDDGLKIYFSNKIIKLRDLKVDKEELKQIVKNEKSLYYNSVEFYYEDDYNAFLNGSDEKVKFIDFENDHGEYLTIEQYEDGEVRVYLSELINNIEVVSL